MGLSTFSLTKTSYSKQLDLLSQDSSGTRDMKSGQNTPSRQPLAAPPSRQPLLAGAQPPGSSMAPPPPLHQNSLPGADFKKVRQINTKVFFIIITVFLLLF